MQLPSKVQSALELPDVNPFIANNRQFDSEVGLVPSALTGFGLGALGFSGVWLVLSGNTFYQFGFYMIVRLFSFPFGVDFPCTIKLEPLIVSYSRQVVPPCLLLFYFSLSLSFFLSFPSQFLAIFHMSEFMMTAIFHPETCTGESFLVNHSKEYKFAVAAAVVCKFGRA